MAIAPTPSITLETAGPFLTTPLDLTTALTWINQQYFATTGEPLTELQRVIIEQVWQGKPYGAIARAYGCTEGHAKDVGAALWQHLTQILGQRVTKQTMRVVLEQGSVDLDPTVPDSPTFVGRAQAIAHLKTQVDQGARVIVVLGEGGLGKTTLAQTFLRSCDVEVVLDLLMAKDTDHITPVERVLDEWFSKDLGEDPSPDFGVTLARLKRHLEQRRIGILIDNLEPALDKDGRLVANHRNYVELLRVLSGHQGPSLTLMTSRDRLCEPSVTVEHYRLPCLDQDAWQRFFQQRHLPITPSTLHEIHTTYGGNAKAMGLIAGIIREDFDSDSETYWQEHREDPLVVIALHNLVIQQFDRLHTLDPEAHRLLCRLGCYRYQSVATVPSQGVMALLWDVDPSQRKRVMTSLRNRSLVETAKGRYGLHPVIRAEAIARLKQPHRWTQDEWTLAHEHAATFWTQSISRIGSVSDAVSAWEAYYHHLTLGNLEAASRVILHSRHNQWGQFLPLGSTLYRMGFLTPVREAIEAILPHVKTERNRGELHNILGDLRWITGQVHGAIACQETAIAIAQAALAPLLDHPLQDNAGQTHPSPPPTVNPTAAPSQHADPNKHPEEAIAHQRYTFAMIEIDSWLSIGLYHIDLGNLDQATVHFEQVIENAQGTSHDAWAIKARVGLALVLSRQEQHAQAHALIQSLGQYLNPQLANDDAARLVYFTQMLGQIYINLGDLKQANTLLRRAVEIAADSHYTQVRARALMGLAAIAHQRGEWEDADQIITEAIALLDTIGALCDLAEAHFQHSQILDHYCRGQAQPFVSPSHGPSPTHRPIPDANTRADAAFAKACRLFETLQAPHQLDRITRVRWQKSEPE